MNGRNVLVENNNMGRPVGVVDVDLQAVEMDELPENMAIVPAYDTDTGQIIHWSLVSIASVQTERTGLDRVRHGVGEGQ